MKLVVSALHFPWDTLPDCMRIARDELGLDGVELSWHTGAQRPHCTDEDMKQIRAESDGMHISAHIWENLAKLETHAAVAALTHWIAKCVDTGATDLVIHGGSFPNQHEGILRVRRALEQALPVCEREGVTLNLENHYAYDYRECCELFSTPEEFMEVFSLDSASLRFCFDTGHGHMTRNGEQLVRDLAPWLNYVHLADCHGVHDDHCMYREGTVPWDALFAAMVEIGYDGVFCVEFPVREDRQPFHDCIRDLRNRFHPKPPPQ